MVSQNWFYLKTYLVFNIKSFNLSTSCILLTLCVSFFLYNVVRESFYTFLSLKS